MGFLHPPLGSIFALPGSLAESCVAGPRSRSHAAAGTAATTPRPGRKTLKGGELWLLS